MAIGPLASSIGLFILYLLGSILSWRHVSLICAVVPIVILVAVFLVKQFRNFRFVQFFFSLIEIFYLKISICFCEIHFYNF